MITFCQELWQVKTRSSNISTEPIRNPDDSEIDFIPILRSGAWSDIGIRPSMEDVYVCADNLMLDYGVKKSNEGPNAFYGVILLLLHKYRWFLNAD